MSAIAAKLATLLITHTAVVANSNQPLYTLSWQAPTNSVLPITNYEIWTGPDMKQLTNHEYSVVGTNATLPANIYPNKFFWVRSVNTLGQRSQ